MFVGEIVFYLFNLEAHTDPCASTLRFSVNNNMGGETSKENKTKHGRWSMMESKTLQADKLHKSLHVVSKVIHPCVRQK